MMRGIRFVAYVVLDKLRYRQYDRLIWPKAADEEYDRIGEPKSFVFKNCVFLYLPILFARPFMEP
jgi:hypothetical protein